ncbi:hypothetical protein LTR48_004803, partial [Friedmanniomyces endolithicus]
MERTEVVQAPADNSVSTVEATSRRSRRLAKHHRSREPTPIAVREDDGEDSVRVTNSNKRRKSTGSPIRMSTARTLPLLICSVGNPGSTYANTLHSAGHTVVNRLVEHLGYSALRKERELGNGLVARPAIKGAAGDWTLWQSTSYMNDSGKG